VSPDRGALEGKYRERHQSFVICTASRSRCPFHHSENPRALPSWCSNWRAPQSRGRGSRSDNTTRRASAREALPFCFPTIQKERDGIQASHSSILGFVFSAVKADRRAHHQGGSNPYFRRARKAMNAAAIAASIAPPAMMKADVARVLALIASSTTSRVACSISSSRSAAASTRLSLRS
jgi:hypothetical protein